jgi:hypothetical protein
VERECFAVFEQAYLQTSVALIAALELLGSQLKLLIIIIL